MLSRSTFLVAAGLILMVILTGWYAASLTRILPLPSGGIINMGVLTKAHVVQTNQAGVLEYEGLMETATELSNGDVHFAGLKLIFYGDSKAAPWHLKSDTGETRQKGEQINLKGNIVLSRTANQTVPALLIKTDAVSLYPKQNRLVGSGFVTFSQPRSINHMQGVGFVANLKQKWIKLLSQVKGIYAPN